MPDLVRPRRDVIGVVVDVAVEGRGIPQIPERVGRRVGARAERGGSVPSLDQLVDYTITVTDTPPSAFIPAGTVSLKVDTVTLPNPQTLSAGTAHFSAVNLGAVGQHTIAVTYAPNDNVFTGNTSSITQTVGQAPTTTTLLEDRLSARNC